MKPMDNMEEAIKKKLNFTASAKMRDRILDDVLKAQEKSKKTIPVLKEPNIWRIIMKSPNTKLVTAALILIAVFIGINLLNGSVTTVAWGDMDGDGDLDLALGNGGQGNQIYFAVKYSSAGQNRFICL